MDIATETPQQRAERHPYFKRLSDDTYVDEIHITTVPRFKQSGLSGDEWRVSARVEFRRKGVLVGYLGYRNVVAALVNVAHFGEFGGIAPADLKMGYEDTDAAADHERMRHTDEDFCAQPGCSEPWTVEYQMVKESCREGHVQDLTVVAYKNYRRRFCDKHATRGDSDLDDMDAHYVRVEPKAVAS